MPIYKFLRFLCKISFSSCKMLIVKTLEIPKPSVVLLKITIADISMQKALRKK